MDQIIAEILALLKTSRQTLDQTLAGLPPIAQFEATSEAACILRQMNSSATWLKEQFGVFDGYMAQLKTKYPEALNAAADLKAGEMLNTKLSAGEYIKKTDADAAQQVAVSAAETTLRNTIKKVSDRRAALVTGEGAIPVAVAGLLSDETLLADDFKVRASKAAERTKKLSDLGVEVPAVLAEAANFGIDDAGEKAFGAKFELFNSIATKNGAKTGTVAGGGESQQQQSISDSDITAV